VVYFVSDKDGIIVLRGQAQNESTGQYIINLTTENTSKLSSGPNQIKIFATSFQALRPSISSETILAIQGGGTNQISNSNKTSSG
jgi:hypothetical protein